MGILITLSAAGLHLFSPNGGWFGGRLLHVKMIPTTGLLLDRVSDRPLGWRAAGTGDRLSVFAAEQERAQKVRSKPVIQATPA